MYIKTKERPFKKKNGFFFEKPFDISKKITNFADKLGEGET